MNKKLVGIGGLVVAFALLLGINMISGVSLKGMKVDLTENKKYTLSQGTTNIIQSIEEPVTLKFYFSKKLAQGRPSIMDYANRVQDFLEQYEQNSKGKVKLEIIDPEPFSEQEENAVRAGLQGVPVSQQERLYFGLQGVNTVDGRKSIPFFVQSSENTLEYDITELIYDLAQPKEQKIVFVTALPIQGEQMPQFAMQPGQQGAEPWFVYKELQELYNVSTIDPSASELPEDTDLVVVVHPKELSEDLKYSIDQYVLKGNKAIFFVDPLCEADQPPTDPQNPMAAMTAPRNSNLPELFKAWGIEMVDGKILGDRGIGLTVPVGRGRREFVKYIMYNGFQDENINSDVLYTQDIASINMAYAGVLRKVGDAGTEITPIITSSNETQLIDVQAAQMFPDPKKFLNDFESADKTEMVAVQISGNAKSAFPDGFTPEGAEEPVADQVKESEEPINVMVFADVDMLSDNMWVQVQNFFGMTVPQKMADNGTLLVNSVDFLSGSNDLISIRGRGSSAKPFEVVEDMMKKAEENSRDKIKQLNDELAETQQRLTELQRQTPDGKTVISSSDLNKEVEEFQEKERETQVELRRVQLNMRKDVEQLGNKLKFLNIGLMPLLVGLFAISLGVYKVNRRRRR